MTTAARRAAAGVLAICLGAVLAGCQAQDWRTSAIADAERQIREEVADLAAGFSRVQLTGDSATGQTCGVVEAKGGSAGQPRTGRFIVYIDKTAGPFVESAMGRQPISREDFDLAWQNDCLNKGYRG